jgi:hypothetical protein
MNDVKESFFFAEVTPSPVLPVGGILQPSFV